MKLQKQVQPGGYKLLMRLISCAQVSVRLQRGREAVLHAKVIPSKEAQCMRKFDISIRKWLVIDRAPVSEQAIPGYLY